MAAPAIVHENKVAGAYGTTDQTMTLSVTQGNTIVVVVGYQGANKLPTLTDTQTNTYGSALFSAYHSGPTIGIALYAATATATGSITITAAKGGTALTVAMAGADVSGVGSGILDGTPVELEGNGTNSSKTMNATSVATNLLWQTLHNQPTVTVGTPVSGFAAESGMSGSSSDIQINTALQTTAATGTFGAGWAGMTNASSRAWDLIAFALKGVAAVSVSLSGASLTLTAGTVAATRPVSGKSLAGSAGTLRSAPSVTLTGRVATATPGTLATARPLAGQVAGSTAGAVVATRVRALTGGALTGSAGAAGAAIRVVPQGSALATTPHSLTQGRAVALTGASASASAGTVVRDHRQGLTGSASSLTAGVGAAARTSALSGSVLTPLGGTLLTLHALGAVTGLRVTLTTGATGARSAAGLSGIPATLVSEGLSDVPSQPLAGQRATLGAEAPAVAVSRPLSGVSATAGAGSVYGSFVRQPAGCAMVLATPGLTARAGTLPGSLVLTTRTGTLHTGAVRALAGTPAGLTDGHTPAYVLVLTAGGAAQTRIGSLSLQRGAGLVRAGFTAAAAGNLYPTAFLRSPAALETAGTAALTTGIVLVAAALSATQGSATLPTVGALRARLSGLSAATATLSESSSDTGGYLGPVSAVPAPAVTIPYLLPEAA